MLSAIRNILRSSRNAALSNHLSNSSSANHCATTAVHAPAILRHGAARTTSNRVHWDGIVTVKPIALEAADPTCVKCDIKRCGCKRWGKDTIGGLRVYLVTDYEPSNRETGSFLRRIYECLSIDAAERPVDLPVPLQNSGTALVDSTSDTAGQRTSKLSRRRSNRAQVAPVEPILQLEAGETFEVNNGDEGSEEGHVIDKKPARILRELVCDLDGVYWAAHTGPRGRRAAA